MAFLRALKSRNSNVFVEDIDNATAPTTPIVPPIEPPTPPPPPPPKKTIIEYIVCGGGGTGGTSGSKGCSCGGRGGSIVVGSMEIKNSIAVLLRVGGSGVSSYLDTVIARAGSNGVSIGGSGAGSNGTYDTLSKLGYSVFLGANGGDGRIGKGGFFGGYTGGGRGAGLRNAKTGTPFNQASAGAPNTGAGGGGGGKNYNTVCYGAAGGSGVIYLIAKSDVPIETFFGQLFSIEVDKVSRAGYTIVKVKSGAGSITPIGLVE